MLGSVDNRLCISGMDYLENQINCGQQVEATSSVDTRTIYQQSMIKLKVPNLPANESVDLLKTRVHICRCAPSSLRNPYNSHAIDQLGSVAQLRNLGSHIHACYHPNQ
jgi:hypothetical protein|uniref:Uncharacterized protein n=1 Tax=Zea mays TaxID=4577 RepID=A0A804QDM6_MAIZE